MKYHNALINMHISVKSCMFYRMNTKSWCPHILPARRIHTDIAYCCALLWLMLSKLCIRKLLHRTFLCGYDYQSMPPTLMLAKLIVANTKAGLTKAYDVTIKSCRKSQKITVSKIHTLWCMHSKFCMKYQGTLWNFAQNFEPIHCKIWILRGAKILTNHDISKSWHHKS